MKKKEAGTIIPFAIRIFFSIFITTAAIYSGDHWKGLLFDYAITQIVPYEGGYWFATGNSGALRYDLASQQWFRYNKDNGFFNQNHTINDMKIMLNKVWFATNYGIYTCTITGSGWQQHLLPGGYMPNWIRGFDTHADTVWIAAFTGLHIYAQSTGQFTFFDISLPGNYQTSYTTTIAASDSFVWIGTDDGVFRYDCSKPLSDPAARAYFGKANGFDTASDLVMCRTITIGESGVWFGLEEYTPSTSPNYCLGGLFYKQGEHWESYDQSNGLTAPGIHFIRIFENHLYAALFHYVNGVNFDGAGLLEMDLATGDLRILNSENWHVETDNIRAFYCSNGDTLIGTEEGLYTNHLAIRDMKPFDEPACFAVRNLGAGSVEVRIAPVHLATEYALFYGSDPHQLSDTLILAASQDTIELPYPQETIYFKAAGMNENGFGPVTRDLLACVISPSDNPILLVQAFHKEIAENTYNYVIQYGEAIYHHGFGFDSVTDQILTVDSLLLNEYEAVNWIAGADQESLNETSKSAIRRFLENGGKLFISGSQIIENISGTGADPTFFNSYLKAVWKKSNTATYLVNPVDGSSFAGLGDLEYGNGDEAAYPVSRPDGFRPVSGAIPNLLYADRDSATYGSAGLQYIGLFGDSSEEGALVYLGFPFETIYPEAHRFTVMGRILSFFDFEVTSIENDEQLSRFELKQNYPNPFNAATMIEYELSEQSEVQLIIWDIGGNRVRQWNFPNQNAGYHRLRW
ncbi:MAG TPA: hypothetical protein ENN84_06910, partial [Candidatus Marinimicrobia bacterium]|nr:hypothetical protein [Candidatus Neomarinimicrobiota bacterium]